MKQYLVTFWEGTDNSKIKVVNESVVWEIIAAAHDNGDKIVVDEIGSCLIDWS